MSDFVKEIAKYFMTFLDTDFKRGRLPKRNTIQKVQKGLRVAFDIEKYPSLKRDLFQKFNNGFEKETHVIKKGKYTYTIPENISVAIKDKVFNVGENTLNQIIEETKDLVSESKNRNNEDYDRFIEESRELTKNTITRILITPLIDSLTPSFNRMGISDNNVYYLEVDLEDIIFSLFESKYNELLNNFYNQEEESVFRKNIEEIININEIKNTIVSYLEKQSVGDAFDDLYILYRNEKIIDKTEIYLYFYEIAFGKEKFPLFYIPITLEKKEKFFEIEFEKRVFLNTKAIDFVVQEFNRQCDRSGSLAGEFERIIYIEDENYFFEKIKHIVNQIEEFFGLNRDIDLNSSELQRSENLTVFLSNACYFYLFDKSDESLINDYEEIINNEDGIYGDFESLIGDFIEKNLKEYIGEVEDEWNKKDTSERLIYESPIPLNEEQKQVLLALEKPDCRFLILEGPPGTGKSHTITAIICKAILKGRSVLVLSDKEEALDVVEDKISTTLNKIRKEDTFQNPILRLGRKGNKFRKILQGQVIQKITDHYKAYTDRRDYYKKEKKETLEKLKRNIKENIAYFENIDIDKIKLFFKNFKRFSEIGWIEKEGDFKMDLLKVKDSVKEVKSLKLDNKIKLRLIDDNNYKILSDYLKTLEEGSKLIEDFEEDYSISKKEIIEELRGGKVINKEQIELLEKIKEISVQIDNICSKSEIFKKIFLNKKGLKLSTLQKQKTVCESSYALFWEAEKVLGQNFNDYSIFSNFEAPEGVSVDEVIKNIKDYAREIKYLKAPVLGYAFKRKKVDDLSRNFKRTLRYFNIQQPEKKAGNLLKIADFFDLIMGDDNNVKAVDELEKFHIFNLLIFLLARKNENYIKYIKDNICLYEKLIKRKKKLEREDSSFKIIDDIDGEIRKRKLYLKINQGLKEAKKAGEKINYLLPKEFLVSKDSFFNNVLNKKNKILFLNYFEQIEKLKKERDSVFYLEKVVNNYPEITGRISLNFDEDNISNTSCSLLDYKDEYIRGYIDHKKLYFEIKNSFADAPRDTFFSLMREVEALTTAEMSYTLDKSVVNYYRERGNDISTLRSILRKKQKFPRDLFLNLKKAFPCILAGVRDYSEFIPLEKDLFDLVIIDEASQVSIAQSLPALIRGKKIVVLGDDKQFSNVKANNASKSINSEFKDRVKNSFCKEKEGVDVVNNGWLSKVEENFDIKNSILKFLRFIRNYECQLRKHFRCYPEIISYSDRYFYNYSLQCMKVRGKNIDDILKFKILEHDGLIDQYKNTNEMEVDYIIKKVKEFKENGFSQSIGIITPHREQVNLLFDKISNMPEREWLFGKCKLKIMTFDTCQGEERDYIFYSMVATEEKDRLNWIFPKILNVDENETIKAQRLNVGFSRAKECMHFVLSKEKEKFYGEIKNALMHYYNELENAKKRKVVKLESPMEYRVEDIFYKTYFYKRNKESIEFIPQFEVGKYLKQIDRNYSHPNYRVDFLLIYNDQKIIIEYDGFKEHFVDNNDVDDNSYDYYIKEDDIYRQKILEGYGYKFLRINKFNIGKDPIKTLDERIETIVQDSNKRKNHLEEAHQTIDDIENNKKRECSYCGNLKELVCFKSDSAKSGYGRICVVCRNLSSEEKREIKKIRNLSGIQKPEEKILDDYEKEDWSSFANNSDNWEILLNSKIISNEDSNFLRKIITKINLRINSLTDKENERLESIILKIKKGSYD